MVQRIAALVFIFICISVAWLILGSRIYTRSDSFSSNTKSEVVSLWGAGQHQLSPNVNYVNTIPAKSEVIQDSRIVADTRNVKTTVPVILDGSDIKVNFELDYRQKGLHWYSTYKVKFAGKYRVLNYTGEARDIVFKFTLPARAGLFDNFKLKIGDIDETNLMFNSGSVESKFPLAVGETKLVEVSYDSQGLDFWGYGFGENVNQIKNFSLVMNTNFDGIDFRENTISPSTKQPSANGLELKWIYLNLLSGINIGVDMPQKLNPAPWVAKVSLSAPVSLFLFFFVLFLVSTVKKVRIHPMNYFFIGAAFFSFHLLLAYLVDHLSIHTSFLISSAVSIILVISYLRIVTGNKFAFLQAGGLQFIYLVLFSYTFFFERYTGLAITILCIVTLFFAMQITGKTDWETVYANVGKKAEPPLPSDTQ